MKTLDTFSRRFLIVSISISLILFSLSIFLLTIQRVTANPKQAGFNTVPYAVGLGIRGNTGYYMVFEEGKYVVKTKRIAP